MSILLLMYLSAYLCGSVSFAMLTSRLFQLCDPRTYGSRNMGATNIARSGHKIAALLTLCGDIAKALLPVWWATSLASGHHLLVGSLAILGHMYPIFYRWKGGKGVASALGVFIVIDPSLFFIFITTWLGSFFLFRISAISALFSFCISLLFIVCMYGFFDLYSIWMFFLVSLIILKHQENFQLLWSNRKVGCK